MTDREIDDGEWLDTIARVEYLLSLGNENIEEGTSITQTLFDDVMSACHNLLNRGEKFPHYRPQLKRALKMELRLLDVDWKVSNYSTEVLTTLEIVKERLNVINNTTWEMYEDYGLPLFRARNKNVYYRTSEEYITSRTNAMINKLKKLYREGQWDGNFNSLHYIEIEGRNTHGGEELDA